MLERCRTSSLIYGLDLAMKMAVGADVALTGSIDKDNGLFEINELLQFLSNAASYLGRGETARMERTRLEPLERDGFKKYAAIKSRHAMDRRGTRISASCSGVCK